MAKPSTDEPPDSRIPPAWWKHIVALGVVLAAIVPLFASGDIASPDEGLYSAQAAALADGSWWSERPAPDLDPDGSMDPLRPGAVDGREHLLYSRHPLYPLLLAPLYALGGSAAMLLLSVVGTVAAAAATSLLTGRLRPELTVPALWVTGLGSPLVFDASLVMAHAPAVAGAAWLMWALARAVDDRSVPWLAAAAPLAVVTALLRSEGVVAVAAIGCATALAALIRPRDFRAATWGLVVVGLAGGTHLLDEQWAASLVRGAGQGGSSFDRKANALTALWNDLLVPWTRNGTDLTLTVVMAAVFAVIGAALLRVRLPSPLLPVTMLLVAAAAALARHVEAPPRNISGLIPAFPLVVGGLFGLRRSHLAHPVARRCGLMAGLTTAGIAVTSYGVGGLTQWGGRFFHVLLPALIPLALTGLGGVTGRLAPQARLVAISALVVLTGSHSVLALRANHEVRAATGRILAELASVTPTDEVAADRTVTLWLRLSNSGDTRMAWREVVDGTPLLSLPRPELLEPFLERAQRRIDRIEIFTHLDAELTTQIVAAAAEPTGWEVDRRPATPAGYTHLRLETRPSR